MEFVPAAIDTEAGRVSAVLPLESEMVIPPAGAFLVNVTVQVPAAEEVSTFGLQVSEERAVGASRAIVADADPLL